MSKKRKNFKIHQYHKPPSFWSSVGVLYPKKGFRPIYTYISIYIYVYNLQDPSTGGAHLLQKCPSLHGLKRLWKSPGKHYDIIKKSCFSQSFSKPFIIGKISFYFLKKYYFINIMKKVHKKLRGVIVNSFLISYFYMYFNKITWQTIRQKIEKLRGVIVNSFLLC